MRVTGFKYSTKTNKSRPLGYSQLFQLLFTHKLLPIPNSQSGNADLKTTASPFLFVGWPNCSNLVWMNYNHDEMTPTVCVRTNFHYCWLSFYLAPAQVPPCMAISFLFRDYGPTTRTLWHAQNPSPTTVLHIGQINFQFVRQLLHPPRRVPPPSPVIHRSSPISGPLSILWGRMGAAV